MGYFTILAAIPGFFLSSLIFMALWGIIAPNFGMERIESYGHADNHYLVAYGGTYGSGRRSEKKKSCLRLNLVFTWGGKENKGNL